MVSSMATRRLLADLVEAFEATSTTRVAVESIGGVDAAKRVRAGEAFDLVVLAADVIDALSNEGRIVAGSRVNIVTSAVAVAVPAGASRPDLSSADGVRRAVIAAATIGYSTGPSGTYLANLFARWGIADEVKKRIVVPPPGIPVGSLVARGEIALGFQQLSELMSLDGIDVVGLLPAEIQCLTTFSGGVAATSTQPEQARRVLAFMAGPDVDAIKRRNGMDPA
jgi:molybdate transport system substrate-binding protein